MHGAPVITGLVAALVSFAALPSATGYWSGEARLASQVWRLEVTVRADSVWLSVPSLWSPLLPAKNLMRNGRVFRFDFPMDIGTVEIDLDPAAAQVVGTLRSSTGVTGSVRLMQGQPSPFTVRELAVVRSGIVIAGSASVPASPGRKPAVIVLHGGGPSSRADSPPYRFWGEYFAARGYVAITYDKRGNGGSTGDWRTVGFGERADDVLALVYWLRQQPDVDPDRIGLLAVSQGTWVASLVADRDSRIRFVVQVSGPVVSPLEADTYAALNSLRAAGLDAREQAEFERLWRQEVDAIRHPADSAAWDRYRAADVAARTASWYTKSRYAPSVPGSWFTHWYGLVADFDPVPSLQRIRASVLWLYGDNDTQSDVLRNRTMIERIRTTAAGHLEVAHFARTGHGFLAPVDSFGVALGPLATPPGFLETLDAWLARHTLPRTSPR